MITLGIIGVVAALTLPNLVDGYYKLVAEARLKKFYSVFNQAIILSEAKNGPKEYWYKDISGVELDNEGNAIETTSEIDKWFSKYLSDFMPIKKKVAAQGYVTYYLNDGSIFMLAGYNGADKLYSIRDILFYPFGNYEQCQLKEQRGGRCCFVFNFIPVPTNISSSPQIKYLLNKGLEPYLTSWDGNYDTLWTHASYGCKSGNPMGHYCTAIIQRNGWKVPKNYPFKIHP